MSGEPGDYIGGTTSYLYTTTTGVFGISAGDNNKDGLVDSVNVSYNDANFNHWWYLNFNTYQVAGKNLVPGFYDNAQRAAFTSTGHPGLDISGDGRGCNMVTGNFTVHEANYDYSVSPPKVLNFTASFEQHCEGGTAALLGTIYYNYTGASAVTYSVNGKVSDNIGNGVANVPVVLSGSQTITINTDAGGNYSFTQLLASGNFRLTPSATAGYIISPTTQSVKHLSANQTVNFTAVPLYNISGQVVNGSGVPIAGVAVALSGSQTGTAFTDNNGNYSFANLRADGNYTVTPSRTNYGFSPSNRSFNTLSGNTTASFTGTLLTYTLGGRVIDSFGVGISQATVNLSGSQATTTQTDNNGNYSFTNLTAGGNYTIAASKVNYTFSPPSQSFSNLSGSFGSINFTGILKTYTLSGVILDGSGNSIPGVTVSLSGSQFGTTATDTSGNYSFTVQAGGDYTVTPSKTSYVFNPTNRSFTNLSANQMANFVGVGKTIQLSSSSYSVGEGDGRANLTVNRAGDTSGAASVNYATSDTLPISNNCQDKLGVASSRCDYATTIGTLQFAAGETSKTISIPIVDDMLVEGSETFSITLSNPTGASLGSTNSATITIIDNDTTTATNNPVESVPFFVRQHYIDFLGREPDPTGNAGWQNILNNCGGSVAPPCDRVEVSSDFFRSEEFQSRGYFIYRFYSAVGKIPHYAEFMPDFAKVSGFLSTQQLEDNKVAFINDFMTRTDFQTKYGSITDPTAYVNALLQTVGLPTHPSKQTWIDSLTNQSITRGQMLRALVESTEMYQKYYNEGFVIMQYFGYLRRDADGSYVQWIQTMQQNNGDYRVMVNGFLNSAEYRQRFGQ
jgi:hypothetical protein